MNFGARYAALVSIKSKSKIRLSEAITATNAAKPIPNQLLSKYKERLSQTLSASPSAR